MQVRRAVSATVLIVSACGMLGCGQTGQAPSSASLENQAAAQVPDSPRPPQAVNQSDETALAIFQRRILPIFQSSKPSTCSECHLSGVDLKQYIRPTQEETFASLVAGGLIDVEKPEDSKLLTFIGRQPEKPSLITQKVRDEEYAAFRAWIIAAVANPQLIAAKSETPIGPEVPLEVVRHARRDRVMASFLENVWSEVGRCAACHSPDRNQKQVKEHGEQVSWIKLRDPQATLDHMVEAGLVNAEDPEQSLLLMKPTLQVEHVGGQKMVVGDRSYKQFRRFIDDYAATVHGEYKSAEELPEPSPEVSLVTEIWLKIDGVPSEFDKLLLQVDLHRQTDSGWSAERVATSDRPVFGPKNLWQHSLSLTAQRGTLWAKEIAAQKLPPGRYLARIYVDRTGKLAKDYTATLGQEDLVGEVEFDSRWPAGYGKLTKIQYPAK